MNGFGIQILSAFEDAFLTVISYALLYILGYYFYSRFLLISRGSFHLKQRTHRLFSLTFMFSLSLYLLVLSEILQTLHTSTRKLLWHFNFFSLLSLLTFILPFSLIHSILTTYHFTSHLTSTTLCIQSLYILLLLYPFPLFSSTTTIISHVTHRIVWLGTCLLATISGLASIAIPFEYLITFYIYPITPFHLESIHHTLCDSILRVNRMKLYSISQRNTSVTREELLVAVTQQNYIMDTYLSMLETSRKRLQSTTAIATIQRAFGWLMILACVLRLGMAINSIFFTSNILSTSASTTTTTTTRHSQMLDIVRFLEIASSMQISSQPFSFIFVLILLGINIRSALLRFFHLFSELLSIPSRIWKFKLFAYFHSKSEHSTRKPSRSMVRNDDLVRVGVLLFAQLIAYYVLSSVVLIQSLLPSGYRVLIGNVFGDIQFDALKRWFDTVFLMSAIIQLARNIKQIKNTRDKSSQKSSDLIYHLD